MMRYSADNSARGVTRAVPAGFMSPIEHVEVPAMMHQMNRRGVVRRADDGDGLSPRAYQQRHSPPGD